MAINNMNELQEFDPTPVTLPTHSNPVTIFFKTRARDVPRKLNGLATSFKNFNVSIRDTWNTHISAEGTRIANFLNNSMTTITNYINTEVVGAQNSFLQDANQEIENIQQEADTLVSQIEEAKNSQIAAINAEKDEFKEEIRGEMDSYSTDVSYSISESNYMSFSGETSEDTYDSKGRLLTATQGHKTISDIEYDNLDRIVSYTETITVGARAGVSKNYAISYEIGKIPKVTEA